VWEARLSTGDGADQVVVFDVSLGGDDGEVRCNVAVPARVLDGEADVTIAAAGAALVIVISRAFAPRSSTAISAMLRFLLAAILLPFLIGPHSTQAQPQLAPVPPDSGASVSAMSDADGAVPFWDDLGDAVHDHADDYVGADGYGPYEQESEAHRAAPPLRYNRVEGLVLGIRRGPLQPGAEEQTRAHGQVAYAFGLDDVRYTAGVESRLYRGASTSLKLGIQYHEQTLSPDRWKTSYLENSLTSIGFEDDFFDYYEAEGLSVYATQTLPRTVRMTAGFRAEVHRPLGRQTDWSVFESGNFRVNPAAERGNLRALVGEVTAGTISDPGGLPSGAAARLAATVADGLGGDFAFNRYEADLRGFLPLTPDTRLGLRLRGGYATIEAPLQSRFTLGGVGSMRGYGQNRFRGTRTLLANVEYLIGSATLFDDVLDDLYLGGLFDAGWVGGPHTSFRLGDVLPSAGFSVGLDKRNVRLDAVWPLHDEFRGRPSIRLRITPSF